VTRRIWTDAQLARTKFLAAHDRRQLFRDRSGHFGKIGGGFAIDMWPPKPESLSIM
jgi:hypothetical protein